MLQLYANNFIRKIYWWAYTKYTDKNSPIFLAFTKLIIANQRGIQFTNTLWKWKTETLKIAQKKKKQKCAHDHKLLCIGMLKIINKKNSDSTTTVSIKIFVFSFYLGSTKPIPHTNQTQCMIIALCWYTNKKEKKNAKISMKHWWVLFSLIWISRDSMQFATFLDSWTLLRVQGDQMKCLLTKK